MRDGVTARSIRSTPKTQLRSFPSGPIKPWPAENLKPHHWLSMGFFTPPALTIAPLRLTRLPAAPSGNISAHCQMGRPEGASSAKRSEEHTSELQSHHDLVCRLLLEKKKKMRKNTFAKWRVNIMRDEQYQVIVTTSLALVVSAS